MLTFKQNLYTIFYKKQTGFSVLEVMIAIFIITIGMIGVLSLTSQSIQAQYINKNTLIASQLAQEGIEIVRNIRDKNWLDSSDYDWDIIGDADYIIDHNGRSSIDDSIDSVDEAGARLNISVTGYYLYGAGGQPSPFYRLITVDDNTDYLEVECKVRWRERGRTYDYTATTLLYDWR